MRKFLRFGVAAFFFAIAGAQSLDVFAQEDISKTDEPSVPGAATSEAVDENAEPVPSRFGDRPPDAAFGAYQRGLYVTAHNLALPRAEAGDAAAQTLLGEIYSRGLGKPYSAEQARYWYAKAAAQGEKEAEFRFGTILLSEAIANDDAEKRAEGRRLMRSAADKGSGLAAFNLAQLVLDDRPGSAGIEAAYPLFMTAAKQNIPDAQYAVAQYFAQGQRPVTPDLETAAFWLQKAASGGFDTAQLEYGQMLLSGVGVERDLRAGFLWIQRAATTGNPAARAELAKLYWGGIGVEPDSVRAAAYYVSVRREGFRDRVLEDFWAGLSQETQRQAITQANELF